MYAGIDEAGRGCWAGPLVASAVVLSKPIAGLNDSKQLSKQKRQYLYNQIQSHASVGLGIISAKEVDSLGLTLATSTAMSLALEQINPNQYSLVIIDGNYNYLSGDRLVASKLVKTIVKADISHQSVSAASIIAKVTRDNYMMKLADSNFPEYSFKKHVGYGTKLHKQLLDQYGPCPEHRQSFKPVQRVMKDNI